MNSIKIIKFNLTSNSFIMILYFGDETGNGTIKPVQEIRTQSKKLIT